MIRMIDWENQWRWEMNEDHTQNEKKKKLTTDQVHTCWISFFVVFFVSLFFRFMFSNEYFTITVKVKSSQVKSSQRIVCVCFVCFFGDRRGDGLETKRSFGSEWFPLSCHRVSDLSKPSSFLTYQLTNSWDTKSCHLCKECWGGTISCSFFTTWIVTIEFLFRHIVNALLRWYRFLMIFTTWIATIEFLFRHLWTLWA